MTDPLQRKTSLPKGSHNQKIILIKPTLHQSPPEQKKEKEGGLVLPAKRQLYRIYMNTIPGGERKEERKKEI